MDDWKYYDVTHRDHSVCNPTSVERLGLTPLLAFVSSGLTPKRRSGAQRPATPARIRRIPTLPRSSRERSVLATRRCAGAAMLRGQGMP